MTGTIANRNSGLVRCCECGRTWYPLCKGGRWPKGWTRCPGGCTRSPLDPDTISDIKILGCVYLAAKLGLSRRTLERWRAGVHSPAPENLKRLRQVIEEEVLLLGLLVTGGRSVPDFRA